MMKLFVKLFGPYPLADGYTVVVTDDDLEIPLEAQGISIFGANHCDGTRSVGAADRARAGPPVVRQLGHRAALARHLAARRASPATPSGCGRSTAAGAAPTSGRGTTTAGCAHSPQNLLLADPGPARHVRRPGLQARRAHPARPARQIGDTISLRCSKIGPPATGTARPSPTTSPGWPRTTPTTRCVRCGTAWLYSPKVPPLDLGVTDATVGPSGPVTRGSVARVGAATALTALCGYAVLYLAARDLEPAGFSVFGVFWGAFGLVSGAAYGLLQETTREVRSAAHGGIAIRSRGRTHPSDADRRRGRPRRRGGHRASLRRCGRRTCSSKTRLLSVVLLCVGLAGFCLHTTLLGHARRDGPLDPVRRADGHRRRASGWRSPRPTFVVGWGLADSVGDRRRVRSAWLMLLAASPATRAAARSLTPREHGHVPARRRRTRSPRPAPAPSW